jgi:hypothetical protein
MTRNKPTAYFPSTILAVCFLLNSLLFPLAQAQATQLSSPLSMSLTSPLSSPSPLPLTPSHFCSLLDAVALGTAQADLTLALLASQQSFWSRWEQSDRAIEKLFSADPRFTSRVRNSLINRAHHLPWLMEALARNSAWLYRLGHHQPALVFLEAAEQLHRFSTARKDLWSTLILNTLARFLLAGWRDSDDPLTALTSQLTQVHGNLIKLRRSIRTPALTPSIPSPLVAGSILGLSTGRAAFLPAFLLTNMMVPSRWVAEQFNPWRSPLPLVFYSTESGHAATVDEVACAMNLPFAFAPASEALTTFLRTLPSDLPRADAILLGSGDGPEIRDIAHSNCCPTVIAIDHSQLVIERINQQTQRCAGQYSNVRIKPVLADVMAVRQPHESAALVVAIHLLEYLAPPDRTTLLRRVKEWLRPGGAAFFVVHLAAGSRYAAFSSGNYANIVVHQRPGGTILTTLSLVPGQPAAQQVQFFFHEDSFRSELQEIFPNDAGFRTTIAIVELPSGFVEARAQIRKSKTQ